MLCLAKLKKRERNKNVILMAKITVIISTKNRPNMLNECLNSVMRNNYSNFDVIVIDSSDLKENAEKSKLICKKHKSNYFYLPGKGKSYACNLGVSKSDAEIIAFTDDDCIVPANWLETIEKIFQKYPEIACIVGKGFEKAKIKVDYPYKHKLIFHTKMWRRFDIPGIGACAAIKRKTFNSVKGFNENMGPGAKIPAAEDKDLAIRILKKGFKLYYDPGFTVNHLKEEYDEPYLRVWQLGACHLTVEHHILYRYVVNLLWLLRSKKFSDLKIWLFYPIKYLIFRV